MAIFQQEIEIVLHVDFLTDESVNSTTLIKYMVSFKLYTMYYAVCFMWTINTFTNTQNSLRDMFTVNYVITSVDQLVFCEPSTPTWTREILYATC